MTTHSTSPLAGLSWLKRGINLGHRNARAVFGAASILMVAAILPSLLQLLVLSALQPGSFGAMVVAAVSTIVSLVILCPLMGGYLRLIDAAEHGRPAQATDVLAPFRAGGDAGRLIGLGLAIMAVYVLLASVLIGALGDGFLEWYGEILRLQQAGGGRIDPQQVPDVPRGLGPLIGIGSVAALFLSGVYAIAFGQVALGRRPIGRAMADGIVGTAKNLLPLLLLAVTVVLAFIPLGIVLALVFGVVALVGGLVHPILAAALVMPLYVGLLIVMYVVMFGVMYYLWRDVCAPEAGATAAPHHVEA